MQLPAVFRPSSIASVPPMYTWPNTIKRLLLFAAVLSVISAYTLLGGGIIALLAILAG